jgi:hypothetical protein
VDREPTFRECFADWMPTRWGCLSTMGLFLALILLLVYMEVIRIRLW